MNNKLNEIMISGSEDFEDLEFLTAYMNKVLETLDTKELYIITGGHFGAEITAGEFTRKSSYTQRVIPASWVKLNEHCRKRHLHQAERSKHCYLFLTGRPTPHCQSIITACTQAKTPITYIYKESTPQCSINSEKLTN